MVYYGVLSFINFKFSDGSSQVVQQSKALHCSARCRAVPQPAVARSPIGRCTIGLVSSGLVEGLASGAYLAPRTLATPCGVPGTCSQTPVTC